MFTDNEIKYIWCCMNYEQLTSEEMLKRHYDGIHVLDIEDITIQEDAIQLTNSIRKKCELLSRCIQVKPEYLEM